MKSVQLQISIVVVVLLLIVGVVLIYQNNKSPSVVRIVEQGVDVKKAPSDSFLKNYIYPQYGFEFMAPANYLVTTPPQSSDMPGVVDISYIDQQRTTSAAQRMRVLVDFTSKPSSFEEYLKVHPLRNADTEREYLFKDFTQRKLGSNIFYSILTDRFEGALGYTYYTIVDNRVYIFFIGSKGVDLSSPGLDTENDQYHVMFKTILSTFKFTQPVAKPDTSNWSTLANAKYGFQVQHPKDTIIELINENDPFSNKSTLINMLLKPADSNGVFMVNVRNKFDDNDCFHTALGADPNFQVINGLTFVRWNISKYLYFDGVNAANGFAYCFVRNNLTYDLITKMTYLLDGPERPDVERDPVLNQILSTFKFTN